MKTSRRELRWLSSILFSLVGLIAPDPSRAVVLTSDTTIGVHTTNYDGQDLVITNCRVTVDGPHTFASIHLQSGAILTHTAATNGYLQDLSHIADEAHTMSSTNPPALNESSNAVSSSILVTDASGTNQYVFGSDYTVLVQSPPLLVTVALLPGSTIRDGQSVLISYDVVVGSPVKTGVNLVVTRNLQIDAGVRLDANGTGYGSGLGPGPGSSGQTSFPYPHVTGTGGGYGGFGGLSTGQAPGGNCYGSATEPEEKGSGGGRGSGSGGSGGGLVRLTIAGLLQVDGEIVANGANGPSSSSGGGSGGSIWLSAQTISGTGLITANGGAGEPLEGGGGGGGRIAIYSATNRFGGQIQAYGGRGARFGGAGTIYTRSLSNPDTAGELVADNGGWPGTNTLLSVTDPVHLTIRGAAVVSRSTSLVLSGLVVSSNSSLTLPLNLQPIPLLLTVTGNVEIAAGGKVDGDGKGYPGGMGPGAGGSGFTRGLQSYLGGGGGHGGRGGSASGGQPGGNGSGVAQEPSNDFGSGGGAGGLLQPALQNGGAGGASVELIVAGTLRVEGKISANGLPGGNQAGGGAGGSVYLKVGRLAGAGMISAQGGGGFNSSAGSGGGGGGGHISIYFATNQFTGQISAIGGSGAQPGGAGTIYTKANADAFGQILADNAGQAGTNTLLLSAGAADLLVTGGAVVDVSRAQLVHNLMITSNGWLNLGPQTGPGQFSISGQATVQAGGGITLDGLAGLLRGQGAGLGLGSGAGHGGYGGAGTTGGGGAAYGSISLPIELGSRGADVSQNTNDIAGSGGGAVRLTIAGKLTLDGTFSVDGTAATGPASGGGSGGSIYLSVQTLAGAGALTANGGAGGSFSGGGGGGGRIAVYFITNEFRGTFSARGGGGKNPGGAGTIFLKPQQGLPGRLIVDNGNQPGTNTVITGAAENWDLEVRGGTATLTENGFFHSFVIHSNGWLTCPSLGTLRLSVLADSAIEAGGGLSVGGKGRSGGSGTGAGQTRQGGIGTAGGGGGYGGAGGSGTGALGGGAYGSQAQPADLGSSGGGYHVTLADGAGGGNIQLTMGQAALLLNGSISANGNGSVYGGAGSGGSISLTVGSLSGTGTISADGGSADPSLGGGGGGGRIAIHAGTNQFAGNISAYGGAGLMAGGAGTIYIQVTKTNGAKVVIDNGGVTGTNTPLQTVDGTDLIVAGGAIVYPPGSTLAFNRVVVDSGGVLTHLNTQLNLELTVRGDLLVGTNGSISVDGAGYSGLSGGPGAGSMTDTGSGSGAGYGGPGGSSLSGSPGGPTYGSATEPSSRGSRGGLYPILANFCQGGGAVRLRVTGTFRLDGNLSANGNDALFERAGGGSGGSIWVTARRLEGFGTIQAEGGAGDPIEGGGGGGGRIAVYSDANAFAGHTSAQGGDGAFVGGDGTILMTNLPPLRVIAQFPEGPISSAVSAIGLTFSSPLNPSTASANSLLLITPNGTLPAVGLNPGNSLTFFQASVPAQNTPGYYEVRLDPVLEDIYGAKIDPAYLGSFIILAPRLSGRITDTNGLPVSYVTVRADGGLLPVLTDTNGLYSLEVPPSWTGSITPSRDSAVFLPPSRNYSVVTQDFMNQDFTAASPGALALQSERQQGNLNLSWHGFSGATYQAFYSTNLVDWIPCELPRPGTNGPMTTSLTIGEEPIKFFRLQISD